MKVPALETPVFIIPGRYVKNADDRLVVLNRIAASVIEARRGKHETHVFSYQGKPVTRMLNSAWLHAAGVSFEDGQDLLGHRSGRITTHYSAAVLSRLIEAANAVCEKGNAKPELVVLRRLSSSSGAQ